MSKKIIKNKNYNIVQIVEMAKTEVNKAIEQQKIGAEDKGDFLNLVFYLFFFKIKKA